ncbi:MAG: polysaccharide biosynthesis C-terminal domain-containing protein, partial [Defluviitaleaceae bacterium]|nr:polysaccharide biosynthesis C-terminal domain-containing protein [Defluviitaleaceae bacterium]
LVILYFASTSRLNKVNDSGIEREPRRYIAREAVFTAFPIIIGVAVFSITNLIDTVMVNTMLTSLGWHTEEVREAFGQLSGKFMPLTTLPVAVATAIATAAIPSIAGSIAQGDTGAANVKINKAVRITMVVSIPAAVGIGVLGDQILLLLFPAFPGGGLLLRVGAVSIIFMAMSQIATGMLQGCGYMKIPVYAALTGAAVKIVLNLLLLPIPAVNVTGSVISTTVCYVVTAGINMYMLMRIMGPGARLDVRAVFVKPLAASAVMAPVCLLVYHGLFAAARNTAGLLWANAVACVLAVLAGALAYFVCMAAIRGIDEQDIRTLPMGARISGLIGKFRRNRA